MYGEKLEILAASKPIDITELNFYFYNKEMTNLPSQETINELYNDLKAFVIQISECGDFGRTVIS